VSEAHQAIRFPTIASLAGDTTVPDEPLPVRKGFDQDMAGKWAECDGGGPIGKTRLAGRQEFSGRLTGEYFDHGNPPWRWYLMVDLADKPANYEWDAVWCEAGNIYLVEQ
jgi:hypothetical protein